MSTSRMAAIATTANASLISYRSASFGFQLRRASTFLMAPPGAVVNHSGSWAWLAYASTRASGFRPRARAAAPLASTSAAAPSEIEEELAAVTVPSLPKAGFMLGMRLTSQVPGVDGAHGALHRLGGEGILLRAAEVVFAGEHFGESAHEAPVPRALQAVVEHVIEDLAVAHAIAAARLGQQVGR